MSFDDLIKKALIVILLIWINTSSFASESDSTEGSGDKLSLTPSSTPTMSSFDCYIFQEGLIRNICEQTFLPYQHQEILLIDGTEDIATTLEAADENWLIVTDGGQGRLETVYQVNLKNHQHLKGIIQSDDSKPVFFHPNRWVWQDHSYLIFSTA